MCISVGHHSHVDYYGYGGGVLIIYHLFTTYSLSKKKQRSVGCIFAEMITRKPFFQV